MLIRCAANRPPLILAGLMAMMPSAAGADDLGTPMFSLGGFGTLGVVHSSEDRADFVTGAFRPKGAGFSDDWSTAVDSLIAAQVTAHFTSKLSGILQVVSQQNSDNSYWPHVKWADIKYQLTPEFSIRAGRIVLPSFMLSDVRKLGYAYPWVRPPIEVYGLVPVDTNDGADVSYAAHLGQVFHRLSASYGSIDNSLPMQGRTKGRHQWSVADSIEFRSLTAHIEYQEASLTIDPLHDVFNGFRNFGPQGNALADKYDQYNKLVTFFGVGAMYDPGRWFVIAEWGTTDLHSVLGKSSGWYATGGYRLAKFTPYATYAQAKSDNLSDPGLPVASLPQALIGPAEGLNAALNSILSSKRVQSTISAGLRWDFMRNTDLKLQIQRTRIGAGSAGGLINIQPGFQLGAKVNLFSATFDFTF